MRSPGTVWRVGSKSNKFPSPNLNVLRILRYASLSCVITRSLIFTSAWYSCDATHNRNRSAPHLSHPSDGRLTFPSDLDMGRPCSSNVQPCVTTLRYGGLSLIPIA